MDKSQLAAFGQEIKAGLDHVEIRRQMTPAFSTDELAKLKQLLLAAIPIYNALAAAEGWPTIEVPKPQGENSC